MKHFLDTNILLHGDLSDKFFESEFIISSETFKELENIKNSSNKSEEIKFKARNVTRFLDKNYDKYKVVIVTKYHYDLLNDHNMPITPDGIIMACAHDYNINIDNIVFVSNDLLCKSIAKNIFRLDVENYSVGDKETYLGYKEVILTNDEMADFYQDLKTNHFDCLINEYLIIKDTSDNYVDKYKWNGVSYTSLSYKNFKSRMYDTIKPLDYIQACAFDSIQSNDITVLFGKAGCGKTIIPFGYIMQGLETQKIHKCHMIYHFEPLKNSRQLGYTKGSNVEKFLGTASLGNILYSKMPDDSIVEGLIGSGGINIIPTGSIRGFEACSDELIFATEAQNLDTYTLKTILQRAKEGCKIILEGDILEQSDINRESGLLKMIDIFKGYASFGCVKLKNNYRNKISELADKLC